MQIVVWCVTVNTASLCWTTNQRSVNVLSPFCLHNSDHWHQWLNMILIFIIKVSNRAAVTKAENQPYIIFISPFEGSEEKQKRDAEFGEVRSLFSKVPLWRKPSSFLVNLMFICSVDIQLFISCTFNSIFLSHMLLLWNHWARQTDATWQQHVVKSSRPDLPLVSCHPHQVSLALLRF